LTIPSILIFKNCFFDEGSHYVAQVSYCVYKISITHFTFGGSGVQTQGLMLAIQVFYCLNHASSPFCSGYFGDGGVLLFA
jgi:hypothetical protein